MLTGTAYTDHPEVTEIVPSAHCVHRFRGRGPVTAPGVDPLVDELLRTLADAVVTHWPPAWAVSDRPATWWAVAGDLAFPLEPADRPGRWVALTCLSRKGR